MKDNQKITLSSGKTVPVQSRFADLKIGQNRCLRHARWIKGERVWLSGLRLESGEWLIVASNQRFRKPFEVYALRWEIETLFQCLKGRGFHREDTRLTHSLRIKKVMALLALGFCWAHKTGEWKHKVIKPLRIKSHGRLEQSLFRCGLDELTDQLLQGLKDTVESIRLLFIFLCPPSWIGYKNGHMTLLINSI